MSFFHPVPWRKNLPPEISGAVLVIALAISRVFAPVLVRFTRIEPDDLRLSLVMELLILLQAAVLIYFACPTGCPVKKLGIRKRKTIALFPLILSVSAALFAVGLTTMLWQLILKFCGYTDMSLQPVVQLAGNASAPELVLLILLTVIAAPLLEELIFRRVLYGFALPLFGAAGALVLQAGVFALMHDYIPGIPGLFLLGVGLQLLYLHTRNLLFPVLVHAAYNGVTLIFVLTAL